jgi:hypothetical protein
MLAWLVATWIQVKVLIADSVLRTRLDGGVVPLVVDPRMLLNSRVLLAEWTSVADLSLWLLLLDRVLILPPLVVRIPDASEVEVVDGVGSLISVGNHG